MQKKAASSKSNRTDPRKNKSLAIRNVLAKRPTASATEVIEAVKKEYGQTVNQNRVYMVKTKSNMASDGRPKKTKSSQDQSPMVSPALWVDAIKTARQLLKVTGSVPNAIALLKAIES